MNFIDGEVVEVGGRRLRGRRRRRRRRARPRHRRPRGDARAGRRAPRAHGRHPGSRTGHAPTRRPRTCHEDVPRRPGADRRPARNGGDVSFASSARAPTPPSTTSHPGDRSPSSWDEAAPLLLGDAPTQKSEGDAVNRRSQRLAEHPRADEREAEARLPAPRSSSAMRRAAAGCRRRELLGLGGLGADRRGLRRLDHAGGGGGGGGGSTPAGGGLHPGREADGEQARDLQLVAVRRPASTYKKFKAAHPGTHVDQRRSTPSNDELLAKLYGRRHRLRHRRPEPERRRRS